jgi:hypothetical protein
VSGSGRNDNHPDRQLGASSDQPRTTGKIRLQKDIRRSLRITAADGQDGAVQDGTTTTVIYEGSNPWVNGDYETPIESTSGSTGTIYVYEDGVRKWQYTNVEFEAE